MALQWQDKRADEALLYSHDWAPALGDGDTIATSEWDAGDLTIDLEDIDDLVVRVTLSGGDVGTQATVTNTITTAGGVTEIESFLIRVTSFEEPVTIEQAKDHLRILDDDSHDLKLLGMIRRAREWVEDHTGIALVRRAFTEQFGSFPATVAGLAPLTIYRRPVISIDAIGYGADLDDLTEFEAYTAAVGGRPVTINPVSGWPELAAGETVQVTYTAGLADGEADDRLRGAILTLVEGEFNEGFAWPQRSTEAAARCCFHHRKPALA